MDAKIGGIADAVKDLLPAAVRALAGGFITGASLGEWGSEHAEEGIDLQAFHAL